MSKCNDLSYILKKELRTETSHQICFTMNKAEFLKLEKGKYLCIHIFLY